MPVLILIEGLRADPTETVAAELPLLGRMAANGDGGRLALGDPVADDGAPLARWLDLPVSAERDLPMGALTALGRGLSPPFGEVWACLGFTHLRLHRDKLLFVSPERTGQTPAECAALGETLIPDLSALGWGLHVSEKSTLLLLSRPAPFVLRAQPLATLEGASLADHLPVGPQAFAMVQLLNQAQMVLAAHEINRGRTAAGRLPLNTPWIWGVGEAPVAAQPHGGTFWSQDEAARGMALARGYAPREMSEEGDGSALVREVLAHPPVTRVVHVRGPGLLARHGMEARRWERLARLHGELLLPLAEGLASQGETLVVVGLPLWGRADEASDAPWAKAHGKGLLDPPAFWRRRRFGEGGAFTVTEARRAWGI